MSDIQRYSQLVEPPHNLMKSRKGYWCKSSDHEAERKADRERITELETRLTTIEKAVEMSDNTSSPESYILIDNDEISLAIYGPLPQFAEEQDHGFDRNASHTADKYVCTCGSDCDAQNDLRSLADAVMKAESILRNNLYGTSAKNAHVELDEVRDIAMNHMSEE